MNGQKSEKPSKKTPKNLKKKMMAKYGKKRVSK